MATGLNTAALTIAAGAVQAQATHAQLYTAEPNSAGTSNASQAPRQALTWATATADMTLASDVEFTGGESSGPCTHIGLWTDASSGDFLGYFALSGDQAFNADGAYTVTAGTISGSSS